MRKPVTIAWLILLLAGIIGLFWHNEWKYSLPTPVPTGYRNVPPGTKVGLQALQTGAIKKPVFLHFFNPDCPCSRFNMPHFRELVKKYGDRVTFVAVPMIMLGHDYTDV